MEDLISIIDNIYSFYDDIKDIISNKDILKYEKLLSKFKKLDKLKVKMDKVDDSPRELFSHIHILNNIKHTIYEIYNSLDIIDLFDDDISSSSEARIINNFEKLTKVYHSYVSIFEVNFENKIKDAYEKIKDIKDVKQIQSYFHEFSGAIDLYVLYNQNLEEKDVELDISMALEEKKWISPFLSFNGIKPSKVIISNKKLPYLTYRPTKVLHNLPKRDIKLVNEENINNLIQTIDHDDKNTKWELNPDVLSENVIYEKLSNKHYRKIFNISDRTTEKINNKQFGRPEAYNKLLTQNISERLDSKIISKINFSIPEHNFDINLIVLKIQTKIYNKLLKIPEKKWEKKTLSLMTGSTLADAIADEIKIDVSFNPFLMSKVNYIEEQYRTMLLEQLPTTDEEFIEKNTEILTQLLKTKDNIFDMIHLHNQYKILF